MGKPSWEWFPETTWLLNPLLCSISSTSWGRKFGEPRPFMIPSNRKARICSPPHRHGVGTLPASGPGPLARQRTFPAWSDIRGTSGQRTRARWQVFFSKVQRKPTSKIGEALAGWSERAIREEERNGGKESAQTEPQTELSLFSWLKAQQQTKGPRRKSKTLLKLGSEGIASSSMGSAVH